MEKNNPLYKNQGMHAIVSIFTVENGVVKVLLIRRKNEPFKGKWALIGGAVYNNEKILDGMRREIREKVGITEIELRRSDIFDKVDRSPLMRMYAVSYIGVIDSARIEFLRETLKTSDADWFSIDNIPDLAYDNNEILNSSLEDLKNKIVETDILKSLFPNGFTMPEIQKTYESILKKKFDRRNFRRTMLSLDLVVDTNKYTKFEGKKPAKLYDFCKKSQTKNILLR